MFGGGVAVALAPERLEVVAGEAFALTVRLDAPDEKVRRGCVELVCRNTYRHDSENGTTSVDLTIATADLPPWLLISGGETTLRIAVPAGSPGTLARLVEWRLRAVIDRLHGVDATAEQELVVRPTPGTLDGWATLPAASPPELWCSFQLSSRVLGPGSPLSGLVRLDPRVAIDARRVRIQLVRVRHDRPRAGGPAIVSRSVAADGVAAEDVHLAPGLPATYSFNLSVPALPSPSFTAPRNEQHWQVAVVVERRLRPPIVGWIEVLVSGPPVP